ncbi:MAG TPA: response regulator [Ignavibacteriaceae bacterium]|nr:response regulator [Ignavibacteriaceae bacterium]
MTKPTILLVEDDISSTDITRLFLKDICNIEIAQDGKTAIDMAKAKKYPTILMDIGLGRNMNGIQATKEIRKIPGYENTPIVALTAYAMKGDKEEFLANGLTDYMSKPFEKNELIKWVKKIIFGDDG